MAEPLGQAATQAPQPIHEAALKDSSAFSLSIGITLASGALPVFTDTKPPAWIILSNAFLSTIKSFITGKAADLQGSTIMAVSYTHLRAHETDSYLVCRLL